MDDANNIIEDTETAGNRRPARKREKSQLALQAEENMKQAAKWAEEEDDSDEEEEEENAGEEANLSGPDGENTPQVHRHGYWHGKTEMNDFQSVDGDKILRTCNIIMRNYRPYVTPYTEEVGKRLHWKAETAIMKAEKSLLAVTSSGKQHSHVTLEDIFNVDWMTQVPYRKFELHLFISSGP